MQQAVIDMLDEKANVDLEAIIPPISSYNDKLETMMAGGDVPDIFSISQAMTRLPNYVAREQVINAVISKASPDKIIIMSSHLVDELEAVIDYAVFIKDGVIVSQGDAENLRTASGMSIVDQYKRIYAY